MDDGNAQAYGGRIELTGLAAPGSIGLNVTGDTLNLNIPNNVPRADVSLTNKATVSVNGAGGGDIAINARNLEISDSALFAGIVENLGNTGTQAGDITLNATGAITVGQSSFIVNGVSRDATNNGGNIIITTGSLFLTDGALVSTSTSGMKNAGNLTVRAADLVEVNGDSKPTGLSTLVIQAAAGTGGNLTVESKQLTVRGDRARISTSTSGIGNAGNLTITTGQLSLSDRAQVTAITNSIGDAGDLTVRASDTVEVSARSILSTNVNQGAQGTGGNLIVDTGRLSVSDGAEVSASTFGRGDAGALIIRANDFVEVTGAGSGLFADVEGASGTGGDLTIETGRLSIRDGANVDVGTSGEGNAGNLLVQARDSVEVVGAGSFLRADVNEGASGTGGDLTIETGRLNVWDGAQISAGTFGSGSSGILTVKASESIELSGSGTTTDGRIPSGLFTSTESEATGAGGNLTVQTGHLSISDGAVVSASSQGSGDVGNLEVTARSILLDNQAGLTAETASGQGGNITLRLQDLLLLRNNSNISTTAGTAQAVGDGGNITINTPIIVAVPSENSDITSNAFSGRGGNISINAEAIFGIQQRSQQTPLSDITASSELGVDGTVQLNSPEVDPSRDVVELPTTLIDASTRVAAGCPSGAENRFVVTGGGGLPPAPGDKLSADALLTDWATLQTSETQNRAAAEQTIPEVANTTNAPLVEATTWQIGSKGEIILTNADSSTPNQLNATPTTCPS